MSDSEERAWMVTGVRVQEASVDIREGVAAFAERRKPRFRGS
jgi:hypothetical protein